MGFSSGFKFDHQFVRHHRKQKNFLDGSPSFITGDPKILAQHGHCHFHFKHCQITARAKPRPNAKRHVYIPIMGTTRCIRSKPAFRPKLACIMNFSSYNSPYRLTSMRKVPLGIGKPAISTPILGLMKNKGATDFKRMVSCTTASV